MTAYHTHCEPGKELREIQYSNAAIEKVVTFASPIQKKHPALAMGAVAPKFQLTATVN
jgi:hypothetical protein